MSPQTMIQLIGAIGTFKKTHPKFAGFAELMIKNGIPEDSIIEVTVTKPGEAPVTANMKVQQSDIELVQTLKGLKD